MATYYWVGGNGTWNNANATNWSSTSGGSGGAGIPAAADTVYFNTSSGSPAVTIASTAACSQCLVLSGANPAFTLSGNVSFSSSGAFYLLQGSLNLNNYVLAIGDFSSASSSTRSIAFGTSGRIEIGSNPGSFYMQTASGFSYTGTFDVRFTAAGSGTTTRTIDLGSAASGSWDESTAVSIGANKVPGISLGTTASNYLLLAGVFKDIDYTGVLGSSPSIGILTVYGDLTFSTSHPVDVVDAGYQLKKTVSPIVITGGGATVNASSNGIITKLVSTTLQLNGNFSFPDGIFSMGLGTLDLNGATLDAMYVSIGNAFGSSVLAFNSGAITQTGLSAYANIGGNFSFTGTFNWSMTSTSMGARQFYFEATSFVDAASTLSVGTTPATNTIYVNPAATGSQVVLVGKFNNIDFSGFEGDLSKSNAQVVVYGDFTIGLYTYAYGIGSTTLKFSATSGTQTITTNGADLSLPLEIDCPGATVSCANGFTANSIRMTNGTLSLPSGQTTTVGSFTTSGTTLKYLQSSSPGTRAILSDSSLTNTVTYLSIKDSQAIGGAQWVATSPTNVNAGNNTGWRFSAPANTFFLF